MGIMKITGKDIQQWGLKTGPVYGVLIETIERLDLHRKQARKIVKDIVKNPKSYLLDEDWGSVAKLLMPPDNKTVYLSDKSCSVKIYGKHMIEDGALNQIEIASKLPVSVQAAIMPDGHQGYGLPIGGVLATDNVVIPFAVGFDIACRMHMTVTDIPAKSMEGMRDNLRNVLVSNTFFGTGCEQDGKSDHSVMEDERFNIHSIKKLKDKAYKGLSTSGSGNHFVEYGIAEIDGIDGKWLAVLSHSGSRGFGYDIAKFYSNLATEKCKLEKIAKNLAWLSMDDEDGQEYWEAMNLAGDYAKACHSLIHSRIVKDLKCGIKVDYENHHNFAWKEQVELPNGELKEVIVHRKGATPAGLGVTGIIPSSMTTPAFLVEGKGCKESICSSSHGTGRLMSRKQAKETFTMSQMKKDLQAKGVELIGGSLDEFSGAYKEVEQVMEYQKDLVSIKGRFIPWMVRMADEEKKKW
jgi:tRNA-splicing ligase RtcB